MNRPTLSFACSAVVGVALLLPPGPAAARNRKGPSELIALSKFFAIERVSGGTGRTRWARNDIYLRVPSEEPQFLGSTVGGPPRGLGPLSSATEELRAVTIAVSEDGHSIVFRQGARSGNKLEPGIYRYEYGAGLSALHRETELSGLSYSRYDKIVPPDVLPFQYTLTYTPKDLLWGVRATGEEFPLALLGATPLHRAAFDGRTDEFDKLVQGGADVDAGTYWDFTPLDLAIIRDQQESAMELLELGADPDAGRYPAFHRAVMLGRMTVVRAMIDRGSDVNRADGNGYTPLHLAVFAGTRLVGGLNSFFDNAETPRSILDRNVTPHLVRLLLDRGADPARRDADGKTPLDAVSETTPREVSELLDARSRSQ